MHESKQMTGHSLPGIVEHVVVMGAPVSTRLERWAMARSVVAGRFVNAYSRRDWVLGLIYRGANGKSLAWSSRDPVLPSFAHVCQCMRRACRQCI